METEKFQSEGKRKSGESILGMKKITAQFYWMLQKGVIEDQNQSIVFDK